MGCQQVCLQGLGSSVERLKLAGLLTLLLSSGYTLVFFVFFLYTKVRVDSFQLQWLFSNLTLSESVNNDVFIQFCI